MISSVHLARRVAEESLTSETRPLRVAYLVPAPGIPVQGPSGASAHVRAIAGALGQQVDLRVYAARAVDHRGRFGEEVAATISGVGGWPSWLNRYRDMIEVGAARRLASEARTADTTTFGASASTFRLRLWTLASSYPSSRPRAGRRTGLTR